ncbi:MAG: folylpolyglutamate synthase/dihydrofolate synthase family protein [Pseudomonadota bacterium]
MMVRYPPGFDLGLSRIRALLSGLNNPQNKLAPIIHVAGTNGKGSTIALMRAMLEASGMAVHVHTSPHLVRWHERFRIAGKLVDDAMLHDGLSRVDAVLMSDHEGTAGSTVFEIMTAVAFLLFSETPGDAVLLEVGLGGEFDATNVIAAPAAAIIAPVALDHQAHLGNTLGEIAKAKAGIIKQGRPVVSAAQHDDARAVIEQMAARMAAPVQFADQDFQGFAERGRFTFQNENGLLDLPRPALPGEHQIDNAVLAIAGLQAAGFDLSPTHIAAGLQNTVWPGRMQRMPEGALTNLVPGAEIWLDGGHNPHGAATVAAILANRSDARSVLICGMLNTKDPAGYFAALAPQVEEVITVPITSSDAGVDPVQLAEIAKASGLVASSMVDLQAALSAAGQRSASRILIGGSLYLVGDALAQNGTPPN